MLPVSGDDLEPRGSGRQGVPVELREYSESGENVFYSLPSILGTEMVEVETDSQGRVTIPEHVRERFGERYRLVAFDDAIKLVPIPDDPLSALGDVASDELKQASIGELWEAGIEQWRSQFTE